MQGRAATRIVLRDSRRLRQRIARGFRIDFYVVHIVKDRETILIRQGAIASRKLHNIAFYAPFNLDCTLERALARCFIRAICFCKAASDRCCAVVPAVAELALVTGRDALPLAAPLDVELAPGRAPPLSYRCFILLRR